jgi:RimJ/RimL family protein N-acetyltransferase
MLEGLLVDLVPYGEAFEEKHAGWMNRESMFWASMGGRWFATQAGVERHRQEHREREQQGPRLRVDFGIQAKDGTPLGSFAVNWLVPHDRLAMLGAMIHEPDYWGGGYGTDALLLVVDYAFDWLDIRKIWLMTMSLNARVLRQMEKVGFREEGRARQGAYADGAWYDAVYFGLLRDEWPGRHAMIDKLGLQAR